MAGKRKESELNKGNPAKTCQVFCLTTDHANDHAYKSSA
jgi:hypothetical protein